MKRWADCEAVLFDLDGTLVDSAPDLVLALNRLRDELGYAPVPPQQIQPVVSKGGMAMLRAGFPEREDAPQVLLSRFLALYGERICEASRLYDGVAELLARIEASGRAWGIVTNKPGFLTQPLVAALALDMRAGVVVSGDTLAVRKPDPAPLLHACAALGADPQRTVMVGDDLRDVQAALAAGCGAVIAAWGYIGADETPSLWQAHASAAQPRALLPLLGL